MAEDNQETSRSAFNYCVCFLDILGQRHAMKDQGLLPVINTEEERLDFVRHVLATTIRPITRLQRQASDFMGSFLAGDDSPTRQTLPPELRQEWDKLRGQELRVQYWSDGLVAFSNLGNQEAHVQINGAFAVLGMAGSLFFMNLGEQFRNPLRGGIDIAWGTELRPGELYGPAIARSYELESEVAQYPRVVVGPRMIEFLQVIAGLPPSDNFFRYSSTLAKQCLQMVLRDIDGQWIVHYLGKTFQETVSRDQHGAMYDDALKFVAEEYERFRTAGESKLATRYHQLLSYFLHFPREGRGA